MHKYLFVLVWLFACNGSFALELYQEKNKIFLPYGQMSVADFDGDGYEELLGTLFDSDKKNIKHSPECIKQTSSELKGCDRNRLGPNPDNFDYSPLNGRDHASRDIRFYDLDNDGYLDAIVNVYPEPESRIRNYEDVNMLFWGKPNGGFDVDLDFLSQGYRGKGETIVVADFNNDGLLEIFIPQYTTDVSQHSRNLFFKNLGGRRFEEVAVTSGLVNNIPPTPEAAQAVDLNNDGCIDLYTNNLIFFGDCKLNFSDKTKELGLPGTFEEGAMFYDYDNDGDLDFIMLDPNQGPSLYENNNLVFTKKMFFPKKEYSESFGISTGDVNGDGFDDVLIAGGFQILRKSPILFVYTPTGYKEQKLNIENFKQWSDLVLITDLDYDGANDIVVRIGDQRIILINPNTPKEFINFSLQSGGKKNQQGRLVDIEYSNKVIKRFVVDGGSGYMANKTYNLHIPNNTGQPVNITYYCLDKTPRKMTVSSGAVVADCN